MLRVMEQINEVEPEWLRFDPIWIRSNGIK
jgi:hypothetical protein